MTLKDIAIIETDVPNFLKLGRMSGQQFPNAYDKPVSFYAEIIMPLHAESHADILEILLQYKEFDSVAIRKTKYAVENWGHQDPKLFEKGPFLIVPRFRLEKDKKNLDMVIDIADSDYNKDRYFDVRLTAYPGQRVERTKIEFKKIDGQIVGHRMTIPQDDVTLFTFNYRKRNFSFVNALSDASKTYR